ncbi:hypothetical protein FACS189475_04280 [Betaproteobacteria bacterium]|nr:hypothetical protein FACS189475_04280 [Betaproteobacteria bacterium]
MFLLHKLFVLFRWLLLDIFRLPLLHNNLFELLHLQHLYIHLDRLLFIDWLLYCMNMFIKHNSYLLYKHYNL